MSTTAPTSATDNDTFSNDKYSHEINAAAFKQDMNLSHEDLSHGNLDNWANQGVLLLNTSLSVRQAKPNSHSVHWRYFTNEIIKYIVETYTNEEKGVRNLKRCLEVIYSKLNLYKFMKPGTTLFGESIIENIEYPFNITTEIADKIGTDDSPCPPYSKPFFWNNKFDGDSGGPDCGNEQAYYSRLDYVCCNNDFTLTDEEKERFIKLIVKIKGNQEYSIPHIYTETKSVKIDEVKVTAEDIKLVVKEVLGINLEIDNINV